MNLYKKIYKKIKKFDYIVIARHIGPDPDALASQIALRDIILNTFPNKKVYAVGANASKFKFLGSLDRFDEELYDKALLIVTDTPDIKRVDGIDPTRFKHKIKIDHHPVVDSYCDIELVDDTASSASQLVIELVLNSKLKITKESAEKLYIGLVSDTNRFLYYYTTSKTFDIVSKLLKVTNININSLYEQLYTKSINEKKFESYIFNNIIITENGVGHLFIEDKVLEKYGIDASTARNMVSCLNYIDELLVWVLFTHDKNNDCIKGSLRSRGPAVNDIASNYRGGGHSLSCGVRFNTDEDLSGFISELDEACKNYKQNL